MNFTEKQKVVDVLNSLEIIETNGGEEAYALFEINEENRVALNEVGVTDEIIYGYGDDETSCILAIGFGEGYADLFDGNELIVFEEKVEIEHEEGFTTTLYKNNGNLNIALTSDGGKAFIQKLTDEQINDIKKVFA